RALGTCGVERVLSGHGKQMGDVGQEVLFSALCPPTCDPPAVVVLNPSAHSSFHASLSGLAPATLETAGAVYEYVAVPLDWWHADRYCEQRFARLLLETQDSELAPVSRLLQSHGVQSPVWVNEDSLLHKPRQRRVHAAPILVFRKKTDTKYVKVLADFPAMPAVTACAHVQWDGRTPEIATVFSYAVPAFINEFQLRGFRDEEGFVRFALIVHGHHSPYLPVFRSDGEWHHFCVTWQQPNGTWAMYADGKRKASATGLCATGLAAPQAVRGHGTFIIGQDQDSLGGTFKEKESFSGNLTDLHVWRQVLSEVQLERVRSCRPVEQGLVFGWSSYTLEIEPTVQEATVQLLCPGGALFLGEFAECIAAYLQLKKAQSESGPSLISRANALANHVLLGDVRDVSVSAAVSALGALRTVLRAEETPVEPADLLGIVRFLKDMSGIEVQEQEQLEMLEQLSRDYVEVAGLILEEQNAERWSEISPVRRALVPAAQPGRPASPPVTSPSPGFPPQHPGESPEAEGRGTLAPGSWRPRRDGGGPVAASRASISPPAPHRYVSTRVGTAVVSSALLSDYQEIRTAVRYRLQHRAQVPRPDTGGAWSSVGCSIVTSHPESTACFCNHTTNFAVLLQVYEVQRSAEEESTLKTLTFIGCGVSFCALIVTFVLFLAVGVPKSERTTVHKNLIFALAAAEALLMFSELAKSNQVMCFAVTALLHLFFMAAFSWMLVEGLLLWSKVVAVNMSEDRRMKFYYTTGWGLPVLIVAVTLATSFSKYVADDHCWLNVQTDIIWAFLLAGSKMLTPNSTLEKQIGIQIWATAKPVLVLLPVLGLTWVCGVLVHLSIVWAYVFIGLNSLQVSRLPGSRQAETPGLATPALNGVAWQSLLGERSPGRKERLSPCSRHGHRARSLARGCGRAGRAQNERLWVDPCQPRPWCRTAPCYGRARATNTLHPPGWEVLREGAGQLPWARGPAAGSGALLVPEARLGSAGASFRTRGA
uniref:Adhesion G protein-coupled receptor D2 n=1 Tax=Crocodylus porosus TaxID=8502 RepID=A0A7M4EV78_CROPO